MPGGVCSLSSPACPLDENRGFNPGGFGLWDPVYKAIQFGWARKRGRDIEDRGMRLSLAYGIVEFLGTLFFGPVNTSVCQLAGDRAWDIAPRSAPICM